MCLGRHVWEPVFSRSVYETDAAAMIQFILFVFFGAFAMSESFSYIASHRSDIFFQQDTTWWHRGAWGHGKQLLSRPNFGSILAKHRGKQDEIAARASCRTASCAQQQVSSKLCGHL